MSTATSNGRDPRLDPQVGDKLVRTNSLTGAVLTREVTQRDGNDIFYRDSRGVDKKCWISSWIEWARKCDTPEADKADPTLRIRHEVLTLAENLPAQLVQNDEHKRALNTELVLEADIIKAFRSGLRKTLIKIA